MALHVRGVVTCRERQTAAVELTLELRDRLATGHLPCPCCGTACRPRFTLQAVPSFLTWSGTHWTGAVVHEH